MSPERNFLDVLLGGVNVVSLQLGHFTGPVYVGEMRCERQPPWEEGKPEMSAAASFKRHCLRFHAQGETYVGHCALGI